jgi:uncharacterized protein YcfJ
MSSNSWRFAALGVALVVTTPAFAAEDMRALQVEGQRGQSAEQVRRDRYECHNWAVDQTGQTPVAAPTEDEQTNDTRSRRAERVERAIAGAAIGGALGGIVRSSRRHDTSDGVLAGAAVGAAVGAATAGKRERGRDAAPEQSDYLRALTACLEGRGYSVALPSQK